MFFLRSTFLLCGLWMVYWNFTLLLISFSSVFSLSFHVALISTTIDLFDLFVFASSFLFKYKFDLLVWASMTSCSSMTPLILRVVNVSGLTYIYDRLEKSRFSCPYWDKSFFSLFRRKLVYRSSTTTLFWKLSTYCL